MHGTLLQVFQLERLPAYHQQGSLAHTTAECQWMYAVIEIYPEGGHAPASWLTAFVDGTNQPESFACSSDMTVAALNLVP